MTHLMAIILGFVEGATEFIPVSSTGHLIFARKIIGADTGGLAFDAILQLSASCALLFYFRKEVWQIVKTFFIIIIEQFRQDTTLQYRQDSEKVVLYSIIAGTIPAIIFGLFLEKWMDTVFRNTHLVAMALILGSILFWFAQNHSKKIIGKRLNLETGSAGSDIVETSFYKVLSIGKGVIIGFFQSLALIPGVSRSGATISGGLIVGLSQEEAVRFSFLLSLPILFGAGLKKLFEVRHELFSSAYGTSLLLGSITAFIVGLISINFLIRYLKNHNLNLFIWYRIILAILIITLF